MVPFTDTSPPAPTFTVKTYVPAVNVIDTVFDSSLVIGAVIPVQLQLGGVPNEKLPSLTTASV